ncbi:recombinase family protein [Salmonella enterica subsp. enterica serovar Weltevreden]|nr:recombinase family protein [Salmonella enterica subsp. enterica serovar Weltevreden]
MSRTFAYCRVSTEQQDAETQSHLLKQARPELVDSRIVSEQVSGSVAAFQRQGFARLIDRMEAGDTLVVLKLDRLGRDAIDVTETVRALAAREIKVVCLDIGEVDLTSAAGKLVFGIFCQFAEFERNRIIERTREAITRRREQGLPVGRPVATATTEAVQQCKAGGLSQSQTAKQLDISIPTVKRHWNK